MLDRAFDIIRNVPILETHSTHFLKVLETGSVATNIFLRRIHNFALDMNWLPWPVLAKKWWPKVRFGDKRAVTVPEHQAILAKETNPERRAFYELCWHMGGAQSDMPCQPFWGGVPSMGDFGLYFTPKFLFWWESAGCSMAIQKQAFYEGAALHMVTRAGGVNIRYDAPFFLLDNRLHVFLKYSTKGRSPWGFTFTPSEQVVLASRGLGSTLVIGLICGSDGVATLAYDDYCQIAAQQTSPVHIACYRQHNEHYEISGPNGVLSTKVPPSMWQRILQQEEAFYAAS